MPAKLDSNLRGKSRSVVIYWETREAFQGRKRAVASSIYIMCAHFLA